MVEDDELLQYVAFNPDIFTTGNATTDMLVVPELVHDLASVYV